jgi:hypothetical protein
MSEGPANAGLSRCQGSLQAGEGRATISPCVSCDVGSSSAVGGHRVVGFQEEVEQQDAGLLQDHAPSGSEERVGEIPASAEVRTSSVMRTPLTSQAFLALIAIASMS